MDQGGTAAVCSDWSFDGCWYWVADGELATRISSSRSSTTAIWALYYHGIIQSYILLTLVEGPSNHLWLIQTELNLPCGWLLSALSSTLAAPACLRLVSCCHEILWKLLCIRCRHLHLRLQTSISLFEASTTSFAHRQRRHRCLDIFGRAHLLPQCHRVGYGLRASLLRHP